MTARLLIALLLVVLLLGTAPAADEPPNLEPLFDAPAQQDLRGILALQLHSGSPKTAATSTAML